MVLIVPPHTQALETYTHEKEIPQQLWEPVLGGKLHDFWDDVIPNPGDEIIVKGSSVSKVLFGFYAYDEETGTIPDEQRADVDIVVQSEDQLHKIDDFVRTKCTEPTKQLAVSHKISFKGLDIGYVKQEVIRDMEVEALKQLSSWARTLGNAQGEYFLEKINDQITRLNEANNEELFGLNHLFQHETVALKLTRNDEGKIAVTVIDPVGFLTSDDTYISMAAVADQKPNPPTAKINEQATELIFLEAFCEMDDFEFDSLVPVWTLETISRKIVMESELDMLSKFWDETSADPDAVLPFVKYMHIISQRIMEDKKLPFKIIGETESFLQSRGYKNVRDLFISGVQKAFSRGCASSPSSTIETILEELPLAGIIHNDLQILTQRFAKYDNGLIESNGIPLTNTEYEFYAAKRAESPDYAFFENFHNLLAENYTNGKTPKNMSEVIGLLLASAEWTQQTHTKQITEVVDNWKPKGLLKKTWNLSGVDFEQSLDSNKIMANIEKFRTQLENKK